MVELMEKTDTYDEAAQFTILIDRLAAEIAKRIRPAIPIDVMLWNKKTIQDYLSANDSTVTEYIKLGDFPKAIRIPTKAGKRSQPRWKAKEVIAWAESYQEQPVVMAARARGKPKPDLSRYDYLLTQKK